MWSLLASTPSVTLNRVDVGGATMGTQTTYFAYGYSGQNRPLIEGINTTEGTSAAGFYLDYGSFEEVFIGAAGNSAEMPNPGVITQFVSKSGSNTPQVGLYYDFETQDIQRTTSTRISTWCRGTGATAASSVRTATVCQSYKNLNVDVGGPIVKDKVWGYFAYLNQRNAVAAPPSGVIQDGTAFNTKLFNYTGKGTYQLNQNNKFVGYLQYGTKQQPNRTDNSNRLPGAVVHLTADSTVLQDSPSWVYKGEWNGTLTQNMFAEVRVGQFGYNFGLDSNTSDLRYEDLVTNEVTGGGRSWLNKRRRNQYTGARQLLQGQLRRRLAQLQVRRRVPGRERQHPLEPAVHRQRRALPQQRRAEQRAPGDQRHELAERAGPDQLLRHRLVANQPPDPERRRPVRPLPCVAAGAGDPGRAVQPGSRPAAGEQRRRRVQQPGAALRRDLRPHRRWQDRAEGQLGPLLLQHRRLARRCDQSRTPASSTPTTTGTTPTAIVSSRKGKRSAHRSRCSAARPTC